MTIHLDPETYYDENTLRLMGLDGELLEEGRADGRLRFRTLGPVVLYKGRWVLDWLDLAEPAGRRAI